MASTTRDTRSINTIRNDKSRNITQDCKLLYCKQRKRIHTILQEGVRTIMIIKITIYKWRFTFSMAPTTKVVGVDSNLIDGNHVLMWDFDTGSYNQILLGLDYIQDRYNLSNIYIAQTGKKTGYHAFCFKKVSWRKCIEILASTPLLDYNYLKYGIYRKHFTLRISKKHARKITYKDTMRSPVIEDCKPSDLKSWVRYETLQDGWHSKKIEVKLFARG